MFADGHVYQFGGVDLEGVVHNTIHRWAPSSGFTLVAPSGRSPRPRWTHAACVVGRKMYVFGGFYGYGPSGPTGRLNDLWSFDFDELTWSEVAPARGSGPPPSVRSHHSAACAGGRHFLVFGGADERRVKKDGEWGLFRSGSGESLVDVPLNDVHSFDTQSRVWRQLTPTADTAAAVPSGGITCRLAAHGGSLWALSWRPARPDEASGLKLEMATLKLPPWMGAIHTAAGAAAARGDEAAAAQQQHPHPPPGAAVAVAWRRVRPGGALPPGRDLFGAAVACSSSPFGPSEWVIHGGRSEAGLLLRDTHAFSFETRAWRRVTAAVPHAVPHNVLLPGLRGDTGGGDAAPCERYSHALCCSPDGAVVFVVGGSNAAQHAASPPPQSSQHASLGQACACVERLFLARTAGVGSAEGGGGDASSSSPSSALPKEYVPPSVAADARRGHPLLRRGRGGLGGGGLRAPLPVMVASFGSSAGRAAASLLRATLLAAARAAGHNLAWPPPRAGAPGAGDAPGGGGGGGGASSYDDDDDDFDDDSDDAAAADAADDALGAGAGGGGAAAAARERRARRRAQRAAAAGAPPPPPPDVYLDVCGRRFHAHSTVLAAASSSLAASLAVDADDAALEAATRPGRRLHAYAASTGAPPAVLLLIAVIAAVIALLSRCYIKARRSLRPRRPRRLALPGCDFPTALVLVRFAYSKRPRKVPLPSGRADVAAEEPAGAFAVPAPAPAPASAPSSAAALRSIFAASVSFGVPSMRAASTDALVAALSLGTICPTAALAHSCGCPTLWGACVTAAAESLPELAKSVELAELWASQPGVAQQLASQAAAVLRGRGGGARGG